MNAKAKSSGGVKWYGRELSYFSIDMGSSAAGYNMLNAQSVLFDNMKS